MSFLPVYFYFIALSFIVSLFVFPHNRYLYIKLFPFFLFASLATEFIASHLYSIGSNNLYIYNFFTVVEFCFYLFIISQIINNHKAKKIIWISTVVYAIISVANIIFFQGLNKLHTVTYSLGCLVIVAACIYYFFELFRLPKSVKLTRNPAFWICSGLLFFYCCGFPLFAFVSLWSRILWMIRSFDSIITILNIFLYSLFTIALLCSKTQKYTSSSS